MDSNCEICQKNKAVHIMPYTVTIKEDAFSETMKETLKADTKITVHLPVCETCLLIEE